MQPNVVLIYTDQQRYDTLGVNGNRAIETRHLDALATDGWSFDNMFVASPMCMPSRAAFATGRYPRVNGVYWNGIKLRTTERTFVETLAANGYTTALFGKLHLWPHQSRTADDPTFGFGIANIAENLRVHPASAYREWRERTYPGLDDGERVATYSDELQVWVPALPSEAHLTNWVGEEGETFLRTKPPEPFFLTLSFVDPHHPFAPPEPYASRYSPSDVPMPTFVKGELDDKPQHFRDGHTGRVNQVLGLAAESRASRELPLSSADLGEVGQELWGRLIAHYYGMVTFIDEQVGRIRRALKESGLDERTIVVFTSDHGELLGDHGLLFKGPHHYDCLLKVPTIVALPETEGGSQRFPGLVEQIDLSATILELCGLAPERGMQGMSMARAMHGLEAWNRESVLVERKDLYWMVDMKTIRTQEWKLTRYAGAPFGELYDLRNDPGEVVNRWDDPAYASTRSDLLALMLDRLALSEDPLPSPVGLA